MEEHRPMSANMSLLCASLGSVFGSAETPPPFEGQAKRLGQRYCIVVFVSLAEVCKPRAPKYEGWIQVVAARAVNLYHAEHGG